MKELIHLLKTLENASQLQNPVRNETEEYQLGYFFAYEQIIKEVQSLCERDTDPKTCRLIVGDKVELLRIGSGVVELEIYDLSYRHGMYDGRDKHGNEYQDLSRQELTLLNHNNTTPDE